MVLTPENEIILPHLRQGYRRKAQNFVEPIFKTCCLTETNRALVRSPTSHYLSTYYHLHSVLSPRFHLSTFFNLNESPWIIRNCVSVPPNQLEMQLDVLLHLNWPPIITSRTAVFVIIQNWTRMLCFFLPLPAFPSFWQVWLRFHSFCQVFTAFASFLQVFERSPSIYVDFCYLLMWQTLRFQR